MMRILFLISIVISVTLSSCNLPISSSPEERPAGMPQFFTNTNHSDVPATPTGPQVGTTMLWVDNSILVYVPGGEFSMGVENGDDNPLHTVNVSSFWIYRAEVTNTQYARCISAGECSAPQDAASATKLYDAAYGEHPVTGVAYAQAEAYCKWVQGDLPTEAQWEKTSRGPQANLYPWGKEQPTCELSNFNDCDLETTDIRQHLNGKSYYEALDLAGNVFEWTLDWYDHDYYPSAPPIDPPGPEDGIERVVRGGGYQTVEADLFSARRFSLDPLLARPDLGFRCVVNDPVLFAPYCEASPLFTGSNPPGGSSQDPSSPSCEPPNLSVGGSYCSNHIAFVNLFTDNEVSIAGDDLSCQPAGEGLLTCSGPDFYSGEVQVCGTCDNVDVGNQPPAAEEAQGQGAVAPGPGEQCPNDGYNYNEETQSCEWWGEPGQPVSVGGEVMCEVGSEPDPTGSICTAPAQPANGQGECPNEGYFYDPQTQMCHWRRAGSRPSGICLDPEGGFPVDHSHCEPGGDIGHYTYQCPVGMEADASGSFCVEIGNGGEQPPAECPNGICDVVENNDFACPVGTYFDEGIQVCVPASGDPGLGLACIPGFTLNEELGCCQITTNTTYPACAPGQLIDPALGCISVPVVNEAPNASCITVSVDLPNCARRGGGDTPGGDNPCSANNGNYSACVAAGCSYDTLTNTCN